MRTGIIKISEVFIEEMGAKKVSQIFNEIGFVPLDIKWSPPFVGVAGVGIYMGLSDLFDYVAEGDVIPEYVLEVTEQKSKFKVKVKKNE
jgi:hypothetical protein